MNNAAAEPVAIVGMEVLLPGAGSLETYWHNLVSGFDAITDVPPNRWEPEFYEPELAQRPDRVYCRRGGFVDELAYFDPMRYGVMPASVAGTEPEQLIALQVAGGAVDDAGGMERLPARDRVGVILGRGGHSGVATTRFYARVRMASQVCRLLREMLPDVAEDRLDLVREKVSESFGPQQPEGVIGLVPNLTASRVANRLNLRGPAYTVDAACASSLIAVQNGIAELTSGRLDAVLAGGVHHNHDIAFWSLFSQLRALSRRGEIRPFDAAADGLLLGEGTGVVVLKRLSDAVRDGDRIHAVIRGIGSSSDGRAASLVNPETSGQVLAVRRAWAAAGLDPAAPDALGLLEAHGTGTSAGDAAELATITEVFGPPQGDCPPVIGSVKSMIGHAMHAAGIAGLIKAVLAVSRGQLLPSLHCDTPRPELASTRFMPISASRPWDDDRPRRAAVSAFGFGGINVHIIVEQAMATPRRTSRMPGQAAPVPGAEVGEPDQVVMLAGADAAAVARMLDTDDYAIRALGGVRPGERPAAGPGADCRLAIVDPTPSRLASARKVVASGAAWRGGRDIWFSPRPMLADGQGRIAFVFPGLEAEFSPRVGDLAAHFGLGTYEFGAEDFPGRVVDVVRLGWLLHQSLDRIGVTPDAVAGYSLGEWTAALVAGLVDDSTLGGYAAGVFDPDIEREDLHHAVIGASAPAVTARLAEYPGVLLTHDNAPAQSVACGPAAEVLRLIHDLGQENILCRLLPFATGVHTPYLKPFLDRSRAGFDQQEVRPAGIPARMQVWSATLAAPIPADAGQLHDLFFRHLTEPVRFRSTVSAMHDAGIRAFLQLGSGQLTSLIRDNLRGLDYLAIPVNVASRSGLAQLRRVATALWADGYPVDLRALEPAGRPPPARPVTTARSLPMRLELGSAGLSLGVHASELVGSLLGVPAAAGAATPPGRPRLPVATLATLAHVDDSSSAAAEFAALLEDTAGAAAAVVSAAHRASAGGPPGRAEAQAARHTECGEPGPKTVGHQATLRVSLGTMPYLRDHCFFPQPDDWPRMADRWPVVPATTIIQHMIDAAQDAAPGWRAIRVSDARFNHWVQAEPARDVEITVQPGAPDQFSVTFGAYARASIETAATYPADPPPPWHHDPGTEAPPSLSAERMYAERVMFHGPQYRGVTAVLAVGERHIRGLLRTPAPPGALLDSGLQLLGSWLHVTQPTRNVSFPVGFSSIRFFGPPPAEGDRIVCTGRITSIGDRQIDGDIQFSSGGRVWAQIDGCHVRRFDSHPRSRPAELFPGRHAISLRQPEGWTIVFDYWPDPASQNSIARLTLGTDGYQEYDQQVVARRKHWLLGRLAVKDAVRFLMWDDGAGDIFPIEITVSNDPNGRPRVHGWPGRPIPEFDVSLAHAGKAAVAMAKRASRGAVPGAPGVGIDVAEIADHPESTLPFALSGPELDVFEAVSAQPGADRAQWFTRFWAAKEAAAKAEGTGLRGAPRLFSVAAATPTVITVVVSGRTYQVSHREVGTPDGWPARRYVVAWTWGPEHAAPQ